MEIYNKIKSWGYNYYDYKYKYIYISPSPMDFAPCSNALRFTALCVHFVLFTMGFTRPCAKQRKKNAWKPGLC